VLQTTFFEIAQRYEVLLFGFDEIQHQAEQVKEWQGLNT
jgi:hypothetical protein